VNSLSIFGANSLAKLLIELVREDGGTVERVVVDDEHWFADTFHNVQLVKYSSTLPPLKLVSAVGYRDMRARWKAFGRLRADGHELANYVSPRAIVARSVQMAQGNIILPGVVIEPLVCIGSGNLIWSQSLIGHEVVVGDNNYIAANCVVGGLSRIGDSCFLGNTSTTVDGVDLADETQVLPGSVLFESTAAHTKYLGSPARPIGVHRDTGIVIQR